MRTKDHAKTDDIKINKFLQEMNILAMIPDSSVIPNLDIKVC